MPQTKDQKRRKAADMFGKSIEGWEYQFKEADKLAIRARSNDNEPTLAYAERTRSIATSKISKLRVLESNTRAAIGR